MLQSNDDAIIEKPGFCKGWLVAAPASGKRFPAGAWFFRVGSARDDSRRWLIWIVADQLKDIAARAMDFDAGNAVAVSFEGHGRFAMTTWPGGRLCGRLGQGMKGNCRLGSR
jgi:hypothetical protein